MEESLQRGVVYVGHLPHGFYEHQLRGYFSQFGTVNKVKVARSKKSGRCKGFAFLEFASDEVAKIVAQTMNNYLMFNKLLKCQFVEHADVHRGMVDGERATRGEKTWKSRRLKAQKRHNRHQTNTEHLKRVKKLIQRERKKRKKLTAVGINYDFPGYESSLKTSCYASKPSHILFEQES